MQWKNKINVHKLNNFKTNGPFTNFQNYFSCENKNQILTSQINVRTLGSVSELKAHYPILMDVNCIYYEEERHVNKVYSVMQSDGNSFCGDVVWQGISGWRQHFRPSIWKQICYVSFDSSYFFPHLYCFLIAQLSWIFI